MNHNHRLAITFIACAIAAPVYALPPAPTWNWVATNWENHDPFTLLIADANTNSPTFIGASGVSLVSGIPEVTLSPGESIHASGRMIITNASGFFPIQFRIGLFREFDPGPTTGVGAGYRGITIENDGRLKETIGVNPNPFSSDFAFNLTEGINAGGLPLNVPTFAADFSLDIYRDANAFDINGVITTGPNYHEEFFVNDYTPALGFTFNRVGFLVGRMVTVSSASLVNVQVSVVPEPPAAALCILSLLAIASLRQQRPCQPIANRDIK